MTSFANLPLDISTQLTSYTITTNADFREAFQIVDATSGAPIDLTGLSFYAQLRPTAGGRDILLDMSTINGLIQVDLGLAQVSFAVPQYKPSTGAPYCTSLLPIGEAALDIVASDGVQIKNLCQESGPIQVTVAAGVTVITL